MPDTGEDRGELDELSKRIEEVSDTLMKALTGTHAQLRATIKELLDVLRERDLITGEERDRVVRAAPKSYR